MNAETERNRELVRRAVRGLENGDVVPFTALLDPEVVYRIIGKTRFSGTFEGLAEFGEKVAGPMSTLLTSTRVAIDRVLADGDTVVVLARGDSTTADGQAYANDYCWVYRLAGGRIVEATEYLDTELVTEVFGRTAEVAR